MEIVTSKHCLHVAEDTVGLFSNQLAGHLLTRLMSAPLEVSHMYTTTTATTFQLTHIKHILVSLPHYCDFFE